MTKKKVYAYSCMCKTNLGIIAAKTAENLCGKKAAELVILPDPFEDDRLIIEKAKKADLNVTIDGCRTGCAHTALKSRKIPHLQFYMTEFGCEKKITEPTGELAEKITEEIINKIGEYFESNK